MASPTPLSPTPSAMLNIATPMTSRRVETPDLELDRDLDLITDPHEVIASPSTNNNSIAEIVEDSTNQSSPFVSEVQNMDFRSSIKENVSPSKIRHSRILSGNEIAPLKILSPRDENMDSASRSPSRQDGTSSSPRKGRSPERRFPIKPAATSPQKSQPQPAPVETEKEKEKIQEVIGEQDMTFEQALLANEGSKKAIQIFEDESTMLENDEDNDIPIDDSAMTIEHQEVGNETAGPDTSMVSTFSTFSAVPNMTMFAKIGHSPTRFANVGTSARARLDPSSARTVRGPVMQDGGHTTTSLMDFSDQYSSNRYGPTSASKRARLSPAKTSGHMPNATPQRHQSNLLDFDIGPLPTPRSVPTVTAREVETLKSQFLSEISSLKASLLGKEAEVNSLKTAVTDAEKRVGETSEQLRELQCIKEALVGEKEAWDKRSQEMETVLRRVKAEIHHGQRERPELESKLEESEKRREAAEIMAQEALSKVAGMRAGRAGSDGGMDNKSPEKEARNPGSREVEIAVERVARELHALYKTKHENKVTALKKSYENRWEKKVRGLEAKIEELGDENDQLRVGRDATMTKVDPGQTAENSELKAQSIKDSAHITELNAEVQKLGAVIESVKQDNKELIVLLEKERVEKGELVSLAEEMMAMQHSFVQPQDEPPARPVATPRAPTPSKDFRSSLTRPPVSGLRAPGSLKKSHTESRIGGMSHQRTKSGGPQGGLPRPGMIGARSGIMSSIEKMGNYRGRGE